MTKPEIVVLALAVLVVILGAAFIPQPYGFGAVVLAGLVVGLTIARIERRERR